MHMFEQNEKIRFIRRTSPGIDWVFVDFTFLLFSESLLFLVHLPTQLWRFRMSPGLALTPTKRSSASGKQWGVGWTLEHALTLPHLGRFLVTSTPYAVLYYPYWSLPAR